jgi:hypothetical protein
LFGAADGEIRRLRGRSATKILTRIARIFANCPGDLSRPAQVFVPEADYDRAYKLFYTEREDEL